MPRGGVTPIPYGVYQIFVGDLFGQFPQTFSIDASFTGYSPFPDALNISGLSFNFGSGPSAPLNATVESVTNSTARVSYDPPQYTDLGITSSSTDPGAAQIINYVLTSTPVSSSIRYGGPYDTIPVNTTVAGTTLDPTVQNLYPDTNYSMAIVAINTMGYTGNSATVTFTTLENTSMQPSYVDTIAIPPYYPANLYYDGATFAEPAYNINSIAIGPVGVHVSGDRGSSGTNLMTLTATTDSRQASLQVDGFGRALTSITQNDITITEIGATSTGVGALTGFYLDASFQLVVPGESEPQTIQFTQDFPSGLAVPTKVSPVYTYYWDTVANTAAPILSGLAASVTQTPVCGVPLVGSSFIIDVSTLTLDQMGQHLYVKNPLIYTIYDTSGVLITDFSDPIPTDVATTVTGTLTDPSGYSMSSVLIITGTNMNGLTGFTDIECPYIADPRSVALADATSPANPALLDVSGGLGQRYTTPFTIDTDPATLGPFDDTVVFVDAAESLLAKGIFNMNALGSDVFIDYQPYGGPDYSNLVQSNDMITVAYQYTTFLWNGVADNNAVGNLRLTITFTDPVVMVGPTDNIVSVTTAGSTYPIDVYYNVTCDEYVSTWLNGNSTVGRIDFNTDSKILGSDVGGFAAGTAVGNVMTYTLLVPTPYISDSSTVVVTVGLHNRSSTGIRSVVCAYA